MAASIWRQYLGFLDLALAFAGLRLLSDLVDDPRTVSFSRTWPVAITPSITLSIYYNLSASATFKSVRTSEVRLAAKKYPATLKPIRG
jgi:hypothetical protein